MDDEEKGELLLGGQDVSSENPFLLDETEQQQQQVNLDNFYLNEEEKKEAVSIVPESSTPSKAAASSDSAPAWSRGEVKSDTRIQEIERKERELAEREAAIQRREAEQRQQGSGGAQASYDKSKKNWPWCMPLVHYDLRNDIPEQQQGLVKTGFYCWLIAEAGYALNLLVMFLMLVTGSGVKFSTFLITCMATGAGIPLSWICWFQALYNLAQTDSGIFANLKFFFHFSFHLLFCALAFLSPPIIGDFNAGLFQMIYEFEKEGGIHKFFGFLCLMNTLIWLACGLLSLWVLQWTFRNFRSGGGIEATQQAGASALIAAKASMNTFGSMATSQKPSGLP